MELFISDMVKEALYKAIQTYGREGTDQKIKELYILMPTLRDKLLEELNKRYEFI